MLKLPPLATVLTFGVFFAVIALVIYRLQRLRRWLHGQPT